MPPVLGPQSNADPHWTFNGGTAFLDDAGIVELTPEVTGPPSASSIVYNTPLPPEFFTVSFELRITPVAGYHLGDGTAFMMELDGPTALALGGGALGIATLDGYGVEFDTYDNLDSCTDQSGNHIGVDNLAQCEGSGYPTSLAATPDLSTAQSPLPAPVTLADGQWHDVVIAADAGAITVLFDGNLALENVALPGLDAGIAYYYGFTGAFAVSYELNDLRNISIVTCP